MRVDIWSDVICPWCYLGKRRLERALAQVPFGGEVEVRWRAYQLDPRATREPGDLRRAIERKYGRGAFDGMVARLSALGEVEGIDYRFDIAQRVNTVDAHRLLAYAATEGLDAQGRLAEVLFEAYFTEGRNVADPAVLAAAAEAAGLDVDRAGEVLAGRAFAEEVAADLEGALDRDVTGVPAFVIEDRLMIPGAQEVETMVSLLTRAHQRLVVGAGSAAGAPDPGPSDPPDPGIPTDECEVDDPRC